MKWFKFWRYPGKFDFYRSDDRLLLIQIGIVVGVLSGFASVGLTWSLSAMLDSFAPFRQLWWAFLIPALGLMLSSLFLEKIMNEGAGHGVTEVIYSVSKVGGLMRLRSCFSRLISSCLTIGSGGSAGPEAPVVMSGAAIGSNIARFFNLNERQRITLVGCGCAGAISAIFNAPLTGMIFSMEIILGEWSMVHIIPIAAASVAGAETCRFLEGNRIAFESSAFHITSYDMAACFGLALIAALASVMLTRMLRKMHHISVKIPVPFWLRAAIGGAIVGLIGFAVPDALGEGYHTIHAMIHGMYTAGLGVAAVACLTKIITTSLTLGWGGSGGVFAPCLVIGSFAGIAFQRLLLFAFPTVMWSGEGLFALLGMAGMMSGLLQAPLTGLFLIVEITGSYDVMVSLIIVSALSTAITHYFEPTSFYLKDLIDNGSLLRPGTDQRVLSDISIREVIETDCIAVLPDMLLKDFVEIVKKSARNFFPVEDQQTGRFLGIINLNKIRPYIFNTFLYDTVVVEEIMDSDPEVVFYDDELSDVLHKMDSKNYFSMPVISHARFIGMVSKATLLDKYRDELKAQTFHIV